MFKKREKMQRHVVITREAADGIITWSKTHHPNATTLILRGRTSNGAIVIDGLVVPPFAMSGPFYTGLAVHDLPYTIPNVGTAHSHPEGTNSPSLEDLNNFSGFVSIILNHPYEDENMGAFDRNGSSLEVRIVDSA